MTNPLPMSARNTVPGLDFVAIDFETANSKRASVCQIGIAKIRNGVVTHQSAEFVMPPPGFQNFGHWNIKVHGITRRMVDGAPGWEDILPRLIKFTGDLPLVGHNVSVEKSVIVQASEALGIIPPEFEYLCTQKLARYRLPDAPSYKLDSLITLLDLPGFTHHDAGEDAVACANVAIHLAKETGISNIRELFPPARRMASNYLWEAS
ncbi:3'-5' exonuclease [Arthrobacter caoxuetaonis]|uniref:3'-5' exonuclease n=1 Tax=Arthrobacter caoxuetaonis TaxID=2886935 RepID=A0A9X1MIA6_9MICC|nr:3'-5' exonuclease [Arthrobacter caoxuetaonis]MCC3299795.1 3'-5' exonuclease [Arthrobacter caoxuetaonis]USQ59305.1 3'-5' exonuclease [Arthrobacter caoxuetaonis]